MPVDSFDSDRRALVAVGAQFFVNGLILASFVPRLPEVRDRLDLGVDDIGLILSLAGGASLAGTFSVGRLMERFGTRLVILAAGSAGCVALASVGWARTWPVLVVGLVAISVLDVFVDVAMNLQASWLSARRPRPVISRLHGLWSLGTLLGGLASAWLAASGLSLEAHLSISALAILAVVLTVFRNLPAVDQGYGDSSTDTRASLPDEPDITVSGPATPTIRSSARRGGLVLFFLAGAFAIAAEGVPMGWAAFRVSDDFDTAPQVAILAYVAFVGGMTLGRLGGDRLAAMFGAHRLMRLSAAVTAVGLAMASLGPSVTTSLIGFGVGGLGAAAMLPRMYDLAARSAGRTGAGLGALTGGLRAADLIFPTVVGSLAAAWSSVGLGLAVVVVSGAFGFFVISGFFNPE